MGAVNQADYWTLVTILGPLLLLGIMFWAISRNKKSRISQDVTERGTRDVYREEQRIHERDPGSGL